MIKSKTTPIPRALPPKSSAGIAAPFRILHPDSQTGKLFARKTASFLFLEIDGLMFCSFSEFEIEFQLQPLFDSFCPRWFSS